MNTVMYYEGIPGVLWIFGYLFRCWGWLLSLLYVRKVSTEKHRFLAENVK